MIVRAPLYLFRIRFYLFMEDSYSYSNSRSQGNNDKQIRLASYQTDGKLNTKMNGSENEQLTLKNVKKLHNMDQPTYKLTKRKQKPINLATNPAQTYLKIREWRSKKKAPVDSMGSQNTADKNAPAEIQKFQTLASIILSVQTKDETTFKVVNNLKKNGFDPVSLQNMKQADLLELIYPCNYNKRKVKTLKEISSFFLKNGPPTSKEELLALPGVGLKIATVYLEVAEGLNSGIGVDTHVHRISNRLGWVNTKNPNETELALQKVFHHQLWKTMNLDIVGFGQVLCEAKKPKCHQCPVQKQCPSAFSW